MFTLQTNTCDVFKNAQQILKTESISLRAKNGVVSFCSANKATGAMLLHKVKAETTKELEFGVAVERFVTLLNKPMVTLDYNGSSMLYTSGRSRGTIETMKPYFEEWPDLQKSGVSVKDVLDNFSFLDLKSDYQTIYVFGGTVDGVSAIAAGDREHAGFLPITKANEFAIPLSSLQSARRLFKNTATVIVDNGTVFFRNKTEKSVSLLRFGQMGDTDPLNLATFLKFERKPTEWTAKIEASILDSIIKSYERIKDVERSGTLTLTVDNNEVTVFCKTKHGEEEDKASAEGVSGTVNLNIDLLKDINRLEGTLEIGVKEGGAIFFMKNQKGSYFSAVL